MQQKGLKDTNLKQTYSNLKSLLADETNHIDRQSNFDSINPSIFRILIKYSDWDENDFSQLLTTQANYEIPENLFDIILKTKGHFLSEANLTSALLYAVKKGNKFTIREIMSINKTVFCKELSWLVYKAIQTKQLSVLKFLLSQGVKIHDYKKEIAVAIAIRNNL